jgi:hypothetical protein
MNVRLRKEIRILKAYAVASTLLFAALIAMAATNERNKSKFGEIDVQRINIVEPDGTLRMVIASKGAFPGIIIKGKEYPHPNRSNDAGMLFYNDEGSENGGLTFGGKKDASGRAESFGHLSFDAYDQDQVFTVDSGQEGQEKSAGLEIVDRPDWPISDLVRLPHDQWKAYLNGKPLPHRRIYLGRSSDHSAALRLKDAEGHDRIVIQVAPDGSPSIQFLDAAGKLVSQLPESAKR